MIASREAASRSSTTTWSAPPMPCGPGSPSTSAAWAHAGTTSTSTSSPGWASRRLRRDLCDERVRPHRTQRHARHGAVAGEDNAPDGQQHVHLHAPRQVIDQFSLRWSRAARILPRRARQWGSTVHVPSEVGEPGDGPRTERPCTVALEVASLRQVVVRLTFMVGNRGSHGYC